MGTALLALLVHLDGSGAVTFLVTIPAMLPLYERLGMDRRVLAGVASLAAGRQLPALDRADDPRLGGAARSRSPSCSARSFRCRLVGLAVRRSASPGWLGRREERRLGCQRGARRSCASRGRRARSPTRSGAAAARALLDQHRAHARRAWRVMIGGLVDAGGDVHGRHRARR